MRKIAAQYLFTGHDFISYPIISVSQEGEIIAIEVGILPNKEIADVEFYNGILCPGFVNAHCHLELSHLRNKIAPHTGITGFVKQIIEKRSASLDEVSVAIQAADREMFNNGIVAVGDISNGLDTVHVKSISSIYYHTFVEVFSRDTKPDNQVFSTAFDLLNEFKHADVVPHASYSVSNKLFDALKDYFSEYEDRLYSIHNQESAAENAFFSSSDGELYSFINKGKSANDMKFSANSAIEFLMQYLPVKNNKILIHNTFISHSDIQTLERNFGADTLYFCLCPNSNLFIENVIPPLDLLRSSAFPICIGTDSLASNYTLSVLDELKALSAAFPHVPLKELLTWATYNGAKALKVDSLFGEVTVGRKPGLILLENVDLNSLRLNNSTGVRRVI
ncbi:MAG: amidohydrolase family protein [Bacteroidales bacterium]|nr:amidohydrolase family protein [Bacteroidales bacterium]